MTTLKQLREVALAATPGVWLHNFDSGTYTSIVHSLREDICIALVESENIDVDDKANAKHIATFSPTTILSLLDMIEELKEAAALGLSFAPKGPVPEGLDPTFYHTLSYVNDRILQERVDAARASLQRIREKMGEGV